MKRILILGALAIGLFFCPTEKALADFVNPGFENGVNDWAQIGHPFFATNNPVHSGSYAAENVITTVDDQEYYGQIYQIIQPVAPGNPVYMEGWLKTDFNQGTSARAGILVEFLASNDSVIDTIKTELGGVNNWFKVYVSGHAPTGTVKVRAGAFIYAAQDDVAAVGGIAYVDDLLIQLTEAPGGIITNPGFESQLSGWTTGAGGSPFSANTQQVHSGTYSAYDSIESVASQPYFGFIYQEENPFTAGTPIYVSAWGKTEISPLAGAKGGLTVQFIRSNGTIISEKKSEIGGMTDWRQLYVSGTAPSETVRIKIGAYLWAGQGDNAAVNGKFYFDDIIASTALIPPPPPQTGLINPGFENGVNDWAWQYRPFVAVNSVKHSGTYAAQHAIGNTNDSNDYYAEISQEFPFSAGETAFITGWAKTAINPSYQAVGGIKIEFYNSSGIKISETQDQRGGNTDWTLLYAFRTAPAGTVKVKIIGFAWALKNQGTINGNVYLDDFTFSDVPPSELIFNPGFENDFSGWTIDPDGYPMTVSASEYHSGAKSANGLIQLPGGSADFWSRVYQEFAFSAGETLYATLWAKTNFPPTSTGVAGLKIEFLNGSGAVIGSNQNTIQGQTGWSYLYASGIAPVNTVKARVSPFISCPRATADLGGDAYFDDVVASRYPLPPPAYPTTLSNAGFEGGLNPWVDLYGIPTSIVQDPYQGQYSALKTIGVTPDDDYVSIVYQDIYYNSQGAPFPVSQPVYLSAYAKSDIEPAAYARVGIKLEYFDAQGDVHVIGEDKISALNNWRQLYVSGEIPAGATRVRVSGFAFAQEGDPFAANGTVHFDSFNYSYSPIIPPALPTQLQNAGFENGLNDWDEPLKPGGVSSSVRHSGNYASYFEIDEEVFLAVDYYAEAFQDIQAANNKRVTFKIWAKTEIDPIALAVGGISIQFLNADNQPIGSSISNNLGGVHDWTQLTVSAISPAGTAKVRATIFMYGDASNSLPGDRVYFDDATLTVSSVGGGCFLAGTMITMADGSKKPIENISVGDEVLAYDEEAKQMKPDRVTEIFKHDKEDIFLVINGHLRVTPIHPVLSKGQWVEIGSLKVGDTLTDTLGRDVAIESVETVNEKVGIYNFEVNPYHTYVADGFIVHNRKIPRMISAE